MDLKIREFNEELINVINEANVPVEVKRLVINDILVQISRLADDIIAKEKENAESVHEDLLVEQSSDNDSARGV